MRAALALLALLAVAHSNPSTDLRTECTPTTAGTVTNNVRNLYTVALPPGEQVYDVTIPNNLCTAQQQVGATVTACDDVAPTVVLFDTTHGRIERRGNFMAVTGSLQSVVYCL